MKSEQSKNNKKLLDKKISKIKALIFLASLISLLLSVYLFFTGDKQDGIFVGLWAPTILTAGTFLLGGKNNG